MKILKLFTNDFVLFLIYTTILIYVYVYQTYEYFVVALPIELLGIAISYYLINLALSFLVAMFLYFTTSSLFFKTKDYTIFKKYEIVLFVFDRDYDNINSLNDFKLKVEKYLSTGR